MAAVGDIDAATLGKTLDRVFGSLPADSTLTTVPDANVAGIDRRIVVQLAVPQSVVRMGGAGIMRNDPDFIPAYVVNHILGGGSFTSRLYDQVREKRGLAYGVSENLAWFAHTALIMGGTATRADRTAEALAISEPEPEKEAEEGPTVDELAAAKDYLKGAYALSLDTSSKIAAQLTQIQLDKLGIDYIQRRSAMIDAVTRDDAKRVAKRIYGSGMLVTVAGRPKGLASSTQ